jgi:hypothetical protein
VSATGNIAGNYILGNGSQLTGIAVGNSFGAIAVIGANTVVANSSGATVNFVAGTGISITTNAATDTITFGGASTIVWEVGGSLGFVWDAPATFYDFGSVTEVPATTVYDLGTVYISGVFFSTDRVFADYPLLLTIASFNPFYDFIQLSRGLLVHGYEPTASLWISCIAWAIVMPVVGVVYFWKAEEVYGRDL